jgi:small-conductance mechanosensitive channel
VRGGGEQDPRQYTTSIGLRYEDLKKVKDITADIKAFLDQHPGVDKKLPYGAGLGSLQDWSVQINLMVRPQSSMRPSRTHVPEPCSEVSLLISAP